jgi:hypothetical protein
MMNFATGVLRFLRGLDFQVNLPANIQVMHPFKNKITMQACEAFYKKYYADNNRRWMVIGINPGRFGGGVTGIPFTDPGRLKEHCGIDNDWPQKQELSSLYIYEMIAAFGGPAAFYNKFYITAVSPLGFTRDNKNLNYYDDRQLEKDIQPFVLDCFTRQFKFGIDRSVAFCLGDGKNYQYLSRLNNAEKLFNSIVPLPHPRFIMQYRLKQKSVFIDRYLNAFQSVLQ